MAQAKPEYAELQEFSDIAQKLVSKFPEIFGTLDISKIKCVSITNKERPDKKNVWEVKAVAYPARLDCPFAYYVVVYLSEWIELDEAHKAAVVFDALNAIPVEEDQEGKCNPVDLKGYGVVLRTLGLDFMSNPKIPNLLTDTVQLQLR